MLLHFNPLSANPTKWPNTLKQFVGKLPTNCLSVFGHFDNLALKGLILFVKHPNKHNNQQLKVRPILKKKKRSQSMLNLE